MNMELKEVVAKYLGVAGGFGKSVALSSLGLSKEEVEDAFSTFDEDYHISRYFHFACAAGVADPVDHQPSYQINGFPQTHVSIDAEVQSIL
jgi:hypothetical protein